MAHIVHTLSPHFTGHIGPVRFRNGHADCTDAEVVEFFAGQPDTFDVIEDTPADPIPTPADVAAAIKPRDLEDDTDQE